MHKKKELLPEDKRRVPVIMAWSVFAILSWAALLALGAGILWVVAYFAG